MPRGAASRRGPDARARRARHGDGHARRRSRRRAGLRSADRHRDAGRGPAGRARDPRVPRRGAGGRVTEFLQLLFQGVALGATYALVALGFVVVYRASAVINFAQGAMLLAGAYTISWLATDVGVAFVPAVLAAGAGPPPAGAGFPAPRPRPGRGGPAFVR